ncbi:methyltransferase domain-containing protein [Candidatus Legionella polyplacis]|uniref:Methyltransferase domain-containing protein n=1 Tax=Candidatus Legionella polyplacis TaxID=2005262 RepID=A0ABZ2GX44_9GAMM
MFLYYFPRLSVRKFVYIQSIIRERLFYRLNFFKIKPKRILNFGCNSLELSTLRLFRLYPDSTLINVNLNLDLSLESKYKRRKKIELDKKFLQISCSPLHLPFKDNFFDLVFIEKVRLRNNSLYLFIEEIYRVMNYKGCLLFSMLGFDTFKELKKLWFVDDKYMYIKNFETIFSIGNLLLSKSFLDPVIDREILKLCIPNIGYLLKFLRRNKYDICIEFNDCLLEDKNFNMFLKHLYKKTILNYISFFTYEILYGNAWKK